MKNFVSGKCPNCGANLELDNEQKTAFCAYCGSKISVEEAVEKLKIELSGKVEVDGINSVSKLYKNAESYMKLLDYGSAFDTYCTIINDNPEEIPAYKGALIAASNNMTRIGNVEESYPSNLAGIINTYLEYIKRLDTESKYTEFVDNFTAYFQKQLNIEKNLRICQEIKVRIEQISYSTNFFKKHSFSSMDYYNFGALDNDYQSIMRLYNQLDDEYKSKITNISQLNTYYAKASKSKGFFGHGIGKAIKWYFIIWLGCVVVGGIIGAIVGITKL